MLSGLLWGIHTRPSVVAVSYPKRGSCIYPLACIFIRWLTRVDTRGGVCFTAQRFEVNRERERREKKKTAKRGLGYPPNNNNNQSKKKKKCAKKIVIGGVSVLGIPRVIFHKKWSKKREGEKKWLI